jgi:peptide/nickel transport system substrate-binding protein
MWSLAIFLQSRELLLFRKEGRACPANFTEKEQAKMRKQRLWLISLVFVFVLPVFMTACKEKQVANMGDNATVVDKPVDGGKVTLAMFSAPKGLFNPIMAVDLYDSYVTNYVFDSLWGYDSNQQLTEKYLAESWELSPDKRVATIRLKQGIRWHDGKPLTVDDLIFTWETLADSAYTGTRFSQVAMIEGARAKHANKAVTISGLTKVDPYTVQVKLAQPIANIWDSLWSIPIPKHVFAGVPVAQLGNVEATKKQVIGSGPFRLTEVKANEYMVLTKNKDYYIKGKPHIDQVVWKVVAQDVAIGALKKGEIDFLTQISPKEFGRLNQDKNLVVKEIEDFSYQYIGINHHSPKLKNKKLRQAMTYAINRQALVDGLLKGHGYVINQHIPKVSWAYNGDLEKAYPYDVGKAKALLAEAGYKDINGDGFVEDPQGKPFTLTLDYPTGNLVREKSALHIVENLRHVGLHVILNKPREQSAHYGVVEQGKVELYLSGWSLTPDVSPQGIWLSSDAFNHLHYQNQESDELIQAAVTSPAAFDPVKRKQTYKKWTELISADAPQIFLYGQNRIEAWNKRIQGVEFDWQGAVESTGILHWWIPKEQQ